MPSSLDHSPIPSPRKALTTAAILPLAAAGAWIARSHLSPDHRPLPPALPGRRHVLRTRRAGDVSFYASDTRAGVPLLLIHSVNAAANAYEVRPLFEHYRRSRPVYSLDLPGFGFSERSRRLYTPRLMTDAIHAVAAEIRARHGGPAIDAIALSLPASYLARAALERPRDYASLGLISPTGFDARLAGSGPDGGDLRRPALREIVGFPLWGRPLFDALVSRPSMRYFLERTWGGRDIDEGLLDYDQLSAHQPGAEYAPLCFLSGYLFPTDTSRLYAKLSHPVLALYGSRGDFVDYRRIGEVASKGNWTCQKLDTGAFPHFEALGSVVQLYDRFLDTLGRSSSTGAH